MRPSTIAFPWLCALLTATMPPAPAPAATWDLGLADATSGAGRSSALVLDSAGLPHVAYWHVSAGVRHAWFNGAYWQNELVELPVGPEPLAAPLSAGPASTNLLINVGVAAAAFGDTPMLVYAKENYLGHQPVYGRVRYGARGGGGWVLEDVAGLTGLRPVVAVGPAGQVHVACISGGDLVYTRRTGSGWTTPETIAPGLPYSTLSLQVDGADVPHLAYTAGSALLYATRTPQGWESEPVADPTGGGSLALDAAGQPRIAYASGSPQTDTLVYAVRGPGGWSGEPVATAPAWLGGASLALDEFGRPRIGYAFGTATGSRLRFAYRDGGPWTSVEPDTTPVSISSASLAIGIAGRPWLSYNRLPGDYLPVVTTLPVAGVPPAPVAARFAVGLAGANPVRAGAPLSLWLDSPLAQEVVLELFDASGRRVAGRFVARAAAGRGTLAWQPGVHAPGLYLLRARAASGDRAVARVVLAR